MLLASLLSNEIIPGRTRNTYASFLDVQKYWTQFDIMAYSLSYGKLVLGAG